MIIYTKAYHTFYQFEPNNYKKHNNQHKLKKTKLRGDNVKINHMCYIICEKELI